MVPDDPDDVAPPETAAGAVGIAMLVRELVVLAVVSHPLDRRALQGKGPQRRKGVFERLRTTERPMRQEPVVADANAEPSADPVQQEANAHGRPGCVPESGKGCQMNSQKIDGLCGTEAVSNRRNC